MGGGEPITALLISIAYFLDPHSARRQLFNPDDYNYQAGTKERLFESPQEVTWDKGSSGLVFYTDAQYWASLKSDEERNCDDWDVDMSTYYKDGKPDLDGSHLMEMREQDNLKQGISKQKSVFKKRIPKTFIRNELALVKNSSLRTNTSAPKKKFNASFLTFVKGSGDTASASSGSKKIKKDKDSFIANQFAQKVMEKHGWKKGLGLGAKNSGIKNAIDGEVEGQSHRAGFGYKESFR